MPDTTPQRLEAIKAAFCNRPDALNSVWWHAIRDLVAMIDALEGQIRDLTRPEEDVKPDPDCSFCYGTGIVFGEVLVPNQGHKIQKHSNCFRCDPKSLIPLPIPVVKSVPLL